ncbi:Hypothetical predicted protein, partial [Paramuricea clavata]
SALICNKCLYWTSQPKEQQKCTNDTSICQSNYCLTSSVIYPNGTEVVRRSCDEAELCQDPEKGCNRATTKSCAFDCCNTYNCNNYTPSSASGAPSSTTGVMVTKFTLSLMVIVGFIFA